VPHRRRVSPARRPDEEHLKLEEKVTVRILPGRSMPKHVQDFGKVRRAAPDINDDNPIPVNLGEKFRYDQI